jgi:hypothetical protein
MYTKGSRCWDELRAAGDGLSRHGGDVAATARELLQYFEATRTIREEAAAIFLQGCVDAVGRDCEPEGE